MKSVVKSGKKKHQNKGTTSLSRKYAKLSHERRRHLLKRIKDLQALDLDYLPSLDPIFAELCPWEARVDHRPR